jgi:hypothetical protein
VRQFDEGETVWLKGNDDRLNMEVTILSAGKDPMGGWKYMVKDNKGNTLDNPKTQDQWFAEEELSNNQS